MEPKQLLTTLCTCFLALSTCLPLAADGTAPDVWPHLVCRPGDDTDPAVQGDPKPAAAGFLPDVGDLLPRLGERVASSLKFELELNDVEDFFFEERTLMRPNLPDRTVFVPHENPEDSLWKASVTLKLSELFRTPEDLASAYGLVAKRGKLFDTSHDALAGTKDKVAHFTATGPIDWMTHLLSGLTVELAMSERQPLNGNELIDDRFLSDDESEETFAVTFDPGPLVDREGRRGHGYQGLLAYAKVHGISGWEDQLAPCPTPRRRDCLSDLAGRRPGRRFLKALLPVFKFEMVDQFDFIEMGGNFLTSPFIEDSLETYTLTWDLGAVFDASKQAKLGVETLHALDQLTTPAPSVRPVEAIEPAAGQFFFHQLGVEGGFGTKKWSVRGCTGGPGAERKESTCGKGEALPRVRLTSDGLLVGSLKRAGEGVGFVALVRDELGREDRIACRLTRPNG